MGFFDFDVTDVLDVVKVGVGIFTAVKSTQIAKDQASLAKKETRRRSAIETARVKRETRIRKAQLLASQGIAGASLSTTAEGVLGLDTSLTFGLSDLDAQTGAQIDQFNLGVSNVRTQGFVDIAASLGTFAVSDVAQAGAAAFSDFITPPAQALPSAVGVPINPANVGNIA
jgi:hypothetical protein